MRPESGEQRFDLQRVLHIAGVMIMSGKQRAVQRCVVTVVNEDVDALVLVCADDAPHRLQYLVHAGIGVGIVIAIDTLRLEMIADKIGLDVDLRQTDADDDM